MEEVQRACKGRSPQGPRPQGFCPNKLSGGHAVVIIQDAGAYYKVKNSWGECFGNKGYICMSKYLFRRFQDLVFTESTLNEKERAAWEQMSSEEERRKHEASKFRTLETLLQAPPPAFRVRERCCQPFDGMHDEPWCLRHWPRTSALSAGAPSPAHSSHRSPSMAEASRDTSFTKKGKGFVEQHSAPCIILDSPPSKPRGTTWKLRRFNSRLLR